MRRTCTGILIVMLMVWVNVASGQVAGPREGAFSISPGIGGYHFDRDQDFQDDNSFEPNLAAGVGLGYNLTDRWAVEGLFHYIETDMDRDNGCYDVEAYLYRLNGLYHFPTRSALVPFVSAGLGAIDFVIDKNATPDNIYDVNFLLNYGVGLKYFFTDNLALRGDVSHILAFNPHHNNFLYTVGLTWLLGGEKPAVPLDSDGDGVTDDLDKCPGTPTVVAVDASGCPLDSDRDGVYNYLDKCPSTPLGVAVDDKGCPFDRDGDGIYNYMDKCPDEPAPGTVDGCPEEVEASVEEETVAAILEIRRIKLNVEFDFDEAVVEQCNHDEIGKVAEVLAQHPDIAITVEGHTDSVGTSEYNMDLSQRRADNVRAYLIEKFGIDGARIKAKGYGESRSIADNATKQGRQTNRRVEAEIEYEVEVQ